MNLFEAWAWYWSAQIFTLDKEYPPVPVDFERLDGISRLKLK